MNYFYYTRSLALLIFFGLFSLPVHAFFTSLSLWTWNPDGKKPIEIFIIGNSHIGGCHPKHKTARRDYQDYKFLKDTLYGWNFNFSWDNITLACLIESNSLFAEHIKKNQDQNELSNIIFDMCDIRGKAYFETKKVILMLKEMFTKFDTILKNNNSTWIDKNALQKSMNDLLSEQPKISAQIFLDELTQGAKTIQKAISSKDNPVDKITSNTLENYSKNLIDGIDTLKEFFNEQLNNKLDKSTFEALINYIINEANLNEKDQTDQNVELNCIENCLQKIDDFNVLYEKVTNCIANVGFILALSKKQKESHNRIVILCENNRAIALSKYLKQYQKTDTACCYFEKSFFTSSSNNEETSHNLIQSLFCLPFNNKFKKENIRSLVTSPEKLYAATQPYISYSYEEKKHNNSYEEKLYKKCVCSSCFKININNKLLFCTTFYLPENYTEYYCSKKCQKKHSKQQQNEKKFSLEILWPWIVGGAAVAICSNIVTKYLSKNEK